MIAIFGSGFDLTIRRPCVDRRELSAGADLLWLGVHNAPESRPGSEGGILVVGTQAAFGAPFQAMHTGLRMSDRAALTGSV